MLSWREAVRPVTRRTYATYARMKAPLPRTRTISRGPIHILGFHSSTSGIGRSAQILSKMLESLGYQVHNVDVEPLFVRAPWHYKGELPGLETPGPVICVINPPELPFALAHFGSKLRDRRRIGYWAYELASVPLHWREAFDLLHEVWVPTDFVREAVQRLNPGFPIFAIPHMPSDLLDRANETEVVKNDKPVILTMFDMRSSFDRKNPLGAIEAYRRAFATEHEARLIVKGNHVGDDPAGRAKLEEAVNARGDIDLMTEQLPHHEVMQLIANCDIFLSLHRAEGFGLSLMEAMHAAKPVVATGWSGNTDFMDDETSMLVPAKMVPVRDTRNIYREGEWAEPDLDAAAQALKTLADDESLRNDMGLRAQASAREYCRLEHFAKTLDVRLRRWAEKKDAA